MKNIKHSIFPAQFLSIMILFILIGSVYGMKRPLEESIKSTSLIIEQKTPRFEKWRNVWIKTSDGQLITMPEWQVDQIKVLQVLLAHQRGVKSKDNPQGTNSQTNPLDLSILKKDNQPLNAPANALNIMKTILEISDNPNQSITFFFALSDQERRILINTSFELEANALSALLAEIVLPMDIQRSVGFHLLQPIITYFLKQLKVEFLHPNLPHDPNLALTYNIRISPDGKYAFTNSTNLPDQSWLWDINTKQFITSPISLNNCQFSPMGKYMIFHIVNSYFFGDPTTLTLMGGINNSNCLTLSPDNNYCLYNDINSPGIITISSFKNPQNWIVLNPLIGHTLQVNSIKFSPNGHYIVSGSNGNENNLILWDGLTFEKIKILEGHTNNVLKADFTPDNKYIISEDAGKNIIIWNVEEKTSIAQFESSHLRYDLSLSLHDYPYNQKNKDLMLFSSLFNLITRQKTNLKHPIFHENKNSIICFKNIPESKLVSIYTLKSKFTVPSFFPINIAIESSNCQYTACSNKDMGNIVTLISYQDQHNILKIFPNLPTGPFQQIKFSPNNDYIIVTHRNDIKDPSDRLVFSLWNIADLEMISSAEHTSLTLSQVSFLYRLYLAELNDVTVVIDENDQDYTAYQTLPKIIKDLVDTYLPFTISTQVIKKKLQKLRK